MSFRQVDQGSGVVSHCIGPQPRMMVRIDVIVIVIQVIVRTIVVIFITSYNNMVIMRVYEGQVCFSSSSMPTFCRCSCAHCKRKISGSWIGRCRWHLDRRTEYVLSEACSQVVAKGRVQGSEFRAVGSHHKAHIYFPLKNIQPLPSKASPTRNCIGTCLRASLA